MPHDAPHAPPDAAPQDAPRLILAQSTDIPRDAGLRGDALDMAVLGLVAVFAVGLGAVAFVVWRGRRRRARR